MYKLDLETRDQIANICWIIEKAREFQKSIYFCFINYTKAFDCVDHNNLYKNVTEVGTPHYLTCLLRNLHTCQEASVITRHRTTDWFRTGKGVYRYPAYLISMQSTSCEMLGWKNHKLGSNWQEKYQQPQIGSWYHCNGRKWRGTKEPLDEGEWGKWKSWFRTHIHTLTWICHGCTCVLHPEPPLPPPTPSLWVIPVHQPRTPWGVENDQRMEKS